MQSLNRKEIAIKTLLILTSILSIILIIEGIDGINSSMQLVENMGGFDMYPIDSSDNVVQGWYYAIIANFLFALCPIIILILSIFSMFISNRTIEISIMAQTVLILILTLNSNDNYRNFIENIVGFYPFLAISVLVTLTIIIVSVIKKKSLFIFYILGLILLVVKYIDVYKFWYGRARGSVSLFSWFNMYGIKYAVVAILGFCILILKLQKQSNM